MIILSLSRNVMLPHVSVDPGSKEDTFAANISPSLADVKKHLVHAAQTTCFDSLHQEVLAILCPNDNRVEMFMALLVLTGVGSLCSPPANNISIIMSLCASTGLRPCKVCARCIADK
jgi:hypothetical protein